MTISFTVDGASHTVAVPETDELPDALEQVQASVLAACGERPPLRYLQARIVEGVLNAVVEQAETSIGEVLDAV